MYDLKLLRGIEGIKEEYGIIVDHSNIKVFPVAIL